MGVSVNFDDLEVRNCHAQCEKQSASPVVVLWACITFLHHLTLIQEITPGVFSLVHSTSVFRVGHVLADHCASIRANSRAPFCDSCDLMRVLVTWPRRETVQQLGLPVELAADALQLADRAACVVACDPEGAQHLGSTRGGAAPYGPLCGGCHAVADLAAAAVVMAAHYNNRHVDTVHAAIAAGELLGLHPPPRVELCFRLVHCLSSTCTMACCGKHTK